MDKISPAIRSRIMSSIRSRDTAPEIKVRKALHALGFRFRLHRKDLPGNPDIVLFKYHTCIFVHGCFWHRHPGCHRSSMPQTNAEFWQMKFDKNVARDKSVATQLEQLGWKVMVIWECETHNQYLLQAKLLNLTAM